MASRALSAAVLPILGSPGKVGQMGWLAGCMGLAEAVRELQGTTAFVHTCAF